MKIKENVILQEIRIQGYKQRNPWIKSKKASIKNDIPAKILIESNEIVSDYLADIYNTSKDKHNFSPSLKLGTITPIQKKRYEDNVKKDYHPVSLIQTISKLYERNMHLFIHRSISLTVFIWL